MTPPRTYAIFNAEGELHWLFNKPSMAGTEADCIQLFLLPFRVSERQKEWRKHLSDGYTCRPIALVDPAKLEALVKACDGILTSSDEILHDFGLRAEALRDALIAFRGQMAKPKADNKLDNEFVSLHDQDRDGFDTQFGDS